MKTLAKCVIIILTAFTLTGCGGGKLIKVRVVSVKKDYSGRTHEYYQNTVVERLDTGERVRISGYGWGNTGDVFSLKKRKLGWGFK